MVRRFNGRIDVGSEFELGANSVQAMRAAKLVLGFGNWITAFQ